MKLKQFSITQNISSYSGAKKLDNHYELQAGLPAFFSFSVNYTASSGYYLTIQNPTQGASKLTILLKNSKGDSIIRESLINANQRRQIYVPYVHNANIFELYPEYNSLNLLDIAVISYSKGARILNCASPFYLTAHVNPQGSFKYDNDSFYLVAQKGVSSTGIIACKIPVTEHDLVTIDYFAPSGIQILNNFGLHDIITGAVSYSLTTADFSPPIINYKINPELLQSTSVRVTMKLHQQFTSGLEAYLGESLNAKS